MKIIDLLNMISKGKEVPKKIKYDGQEWEYNPINDYEGKKYGGCLLNQITLDHLTDEVEILEEEKKIPEKLEEFDIQGLEVSGYSMTQAEYLLEDGIKENREMLNWILDYLKSKGE